MKNKMKKIFSKITILVLLVAMVLPYTSIPKVEAATETECEGDWEYHTNYYFFLEADHPHTWVTNLANGKGGKEFTSNFYTSFLYNFPYDGSKIEFDEANSGLVRITRTGDYNENFVPSYNTNSWSAKQFYYEYTKEGNGASGNYQQYTYSFSGKNGTTADDSIVTYLYHGSWANAGNAGNLNLNSTGKLNFIGGGVNLTNGGKLTNTQLERFVNSTIFIDEGSTSFNDIHIGKGNQSQNIDYSFNQIKGAINNFNNAKGNPLETGAVSKFDNNPVIQLLITRRYELNDIFDNNAVKNTFGYDLNSAKVMGDGNGGLALTNGTTADFTTNGKGRLYFPQGLSEDNTPISSANIEDEEGKVISATTTALSKQHSYFLKTNYSATTADPDGSNWFFAPTLYKIAYKVCKDSGNGENQVTLSYNGNESYVDSSDKAESIPEKVTKTKGSEFTISDKTPTLKGYKFDSWNVSPKCDGESYEAKYDLGKLENDLPLYACWKSTEEGDQVKSGVLTYTGLFGGIIALAGGSYYIMKKKNLFKQI